MAPFGNQDKLRALVVTSATRSPALPDVPTVAEAGVAGFEFDTWYGVFAPSATPKAVVRQVSADIVRVLGLPEVKAQLSSRGAVPRPSAPEEFDAFVRSEIDKMAAIVKAAGLKTD